MNATITFVVKHFFSSYVFSKTDVPIAHHRTISGAAGLFSVTIKDNDVLKDHLVSSLTRATVPLLDDSLAARRSVVAALAKDDGQYAYTSLDLY